mgnify:CR=1 FL=1
MILSVTILIICGISVLFNQLCKRSIVKHLDLVRRDRNIRDRPFETVSFLIQKTYMYLCSISRRTPLI